MQPVSCEIIRLRLRLHALLTPPRAPGSLYEGQLDARLRPHGVGLRKWDETCPVSTGGGTRRVQSVREGGGGGLRNFPGAAAQAPAGGPAASAGFGPGGAPRSHLWVADVALQALGGAGGPEAGSGGAGADTGSDDHCLTGGGKRARVEGTLGAGRLWVAGTWQAGQVTPFPDRKELQAPLPPHLQRLPRRTGRAR